MAPKRHRRAFTLVELTLSMAVATILLGGMASALVLASRAIPSSNDPAMLRIEGHAVVEQLANDLWCAQTFTSQSANAVSFTVADRNDLDNSPDQITYSWSGVPGASLYQTMGGEPAREIAKDVHAFQFLYGLSSTSETVTQETLSWGPAQTLLYYDNWPGVTATLQSLSLGTSNHASQYFTISPPADAVALEITRAWAMLQKGFVSLGNAVAEIRRSTNDDNYLPASAVIGTPSVRSVTGLLSAFSWTDFPFSDVNITDLTRNDYCLVVRGSVLNLGNLQVNYNKSAPANGIVYRWTTDGGATWSPTTVDIHKRDIPIRIEGRFQLRTVTEVNVDHNYATSVRIALQLGTNPLSWTETTVEILNEPEVSGP